MRIVVGDIGGTHARFALAELRAERPPSLGEVRKYRTCEHDGFLSAWRAFARDVGGDLPGYASLGIAAPIEGEVLRFVNSGWEIRPAELARELALDRLHLLNDFGAVAIAVTALPSERLEPICGPATGLPATGVTSVIGPGTGLGVSLIHRRGSAFEIIETEAAHIAFAPQTEAEARLEAGVRARYGRCSVERIVSGPGLLEIYAHLGGAAPDALNASTLWASALDGSDALAAQSLDLLIGCFGSAAGDIALAHGAMSLVIASGLAIRMKEKLTEGRFAARFIDKGRYRSRMERIPVLLATYPEPGLLGAAIAFQRHYCET